MAQVKAGWSMPLEVDIRFMLPEVMSAMQAGYDASGLGQKTGRLRRAIGTLANYKLFKRDIRLTIPLPYARIQDLGGQVRSRPVGREMAKGKYMHYRAYGREWFMKRVNGFTLTGKFYIAKGGGEISRRFNSGRNVVSVRWKKDRKRG